MTSFWQGSITDKHDEIIRLLEGATAHPLDSVANGTSGIPVGASGVYALYYSGPCGDCRSGGGVRYPVYIGSACASPTGPRGKARLLGRLREHRTSIAASTLQTADIKFRFVTLPDELAVSAEHFLMHHYDPIWNKSGFGSKPHGSGRPAQKISVWDSRHPGRSGRGTVARAETSKTQPRSVRQPAKHV